MAVVWFLLKWIGIVILVLLGLLLFALVTVLFCPIRYRLEASYCGKGELDLKVSWLFSLLRGRISYGEEDWEVSFFLMWKRLQEKEGKGKKERPKENGVPFTDPLQETEHNSAPSKESPEEKEESRDVPSKKEETPVGNKPKEKRKITFPFRRIYDKIKGLKEKKDQVQAFLEDPQNKREFALIKKQLFKLLHHLLPKTFQARLRFGFDDPALTGQVLGIICMFYGLYGNNLSLEPDFEQTVLEGECFIKGRFCVGVTAWILGRLLLRKRIRSWIFQFIK